MTNPDRHFVLGSSLGMALLALLLVPISDPLLLVALLVPAVALVGLPHGSLDYALGERLFRARWGVVWLPGFLVGYLIAAALTLGFWLHWPVAALAGFLLMTWWHFGEGMGEWVPGRHRWLRLVLPWLQGGVVILFPLLRHSREVADIFGRIVPERAKAGAMSLALEFGPWLNLLLVPILAGVLACLWSRAFRPSGTREEWRALALQLTTVALLFWLSHPLVAFGIYFSVWHSPFHFREHWSELTARLDARQVRRVAWQTLVVTMVTILAGVLVWPFLRDRLALLDAALGLVFAGLAALTVPHMILSQISRRVGRHAVARVAVRPGASLVAP